MVMPERKQVRKKGEEHVIKSIVAFTLFSLSINSNRRREKQVYSRLASLNWVWRFVKKLKRELLFYK